MTVLAIGCLVQPERSKVSPKSPASGRACHDDVRLGHLYRLKDQYWSAAGTNPTEAQFATVRAESATTWWAVVQSMAGADYLVRTTGQRDTMGRGSSPCFGLLITSSHTECPWKVADASAGSGGPSTAARRGERSGPFRAYARRPTSSTTFMGWCAEIGAAAGSSWVTLYRTLDGGASWTMVSRTAPPTGGASTPESLPAAATTTLSFHVAQISAGRRKVECTVSSAVLYTSEDGGARWYALSTGAATGSGCCAK